MTRYTDLLSSIDFEYWKEKNSYFSGTQPNDSMSIALGMIKKSGYLLDFDPRTALDYVRAISVEIAQFDHNTPDFTRLLVVFDLIQAWGGKMGRTPYVRKNKAGLSGRQRSDDWKELYLEGVKNSLNNEPVAALNCWLNINGLGPSFATKHLRFWSGKFPVLDTRISILLCGSTRLLRSAKGYAEFLELVQPLLSKFNTDLIELEKSLFAFSQAFFINSRLELRSNKNAYEKDMGIAVKLAAL
jgi:hypothetical protein